MRVLRADPTTSRRQAAWIAGMEPWLSLGYQAKRLGAWLRRSAVQRRVFVAVAARKVLGVVVVQPDVLLGNFISLLAVYPGAQGKGTGLALAGHVSRLTFRRRRWLYVSSDSRNKIAARFYRRLGFVHVGRLPGLIRPHRTEILWRLKSPLRTYT